MLTLQIHSKKPGLFVVFATLDNMAIHLEIFRAVPPSPPLMASDKFISHYIYNVQDLGESINTVAIWTNSKDQGKEPDTWSWRFCLITGHNHILWFSTLQLHVVCDQFTETDNSNLHFNI